MKLDYLLSDVRAVSSGVGVVLLAVVSLALAAVLGTFVLTHSDLIQQDAPQASLEWEYNEAEQSVSVYHKNGDELNRSELDVSESGTRDGISLVGSGEKGGYAPDEEVANGSYETGETIKIVWKAAESDTTVTIAESTAPSD